MKKILIICVLSLASPIFVLAAFNLLPGNPWTAQSISDALTALANILIIIGITGAVIAIVVAGILYFTAGFNFNDVAKARGLFKNALIGILLILGAGVIINTVAGVITGGFFGTSGSNQLPLLHDSPREKHKFANQSLLLKNFRWWL